MAFPVVSMAQSANPFADALKGGSAYVGVAGGWNAAADRDIKIPQFNAKSEQRTDDGWVGLGTLGYSLPSGVRTELEFGYRSNAADSGTNKTTGVTQTVNGNINVLTLMTNVLYDFRNKTAFTPYIGGGIGVANIAFDNVQVANSLYGADDSDWAPAAQAIVGVSYKLKQNISVFTSYQYLATLTDVELTSNTGTQIKTDYDSHSILAGVRFSF